MNMAATSINMAATDIKVLIKLVEKQLKSPDVEGLKYVLKDKFQECQLEKLQTGKDVAMFFEKEKFLDNQIKKVLQLIGRNDLIMKLEKYIGRATEIKCCFLVKGAIWRPRVKYGVYCTLFSRPDCSYSIPQNLETRLKFFICSVAFNGSDGMKLPNLNDINEGKVIPSEEPCSFFENRTRYSCEPTPFLVSACLAKRLKRQHERAQDPKVEEFKQNIQNRRRTNSNRREYTQQKSDAEYASVPIVHVPKGFGVVPFHAKSQSDVVARYRQIAEMPAPNVSVLKQLLIGPEFEQPQSFHFSNSDVRDIASYNNFSQCLPSEERATESQSSVSNISTLSHRMMNNGISANINYKDA